ncbi:MAG: HAMP domain-containing histidine kinase [Geobacter sp.]|nr:HAMP domain-containing histidine kinase [Geobacter sp.]
MESIELQTCYASPHRAMPDVLLRQRGLLTADEGLCNLLDAMPELVMVLNEHRQILIANQALADFATSQGYSSCVGMRPGEVLACHSALDAPSGCGTADGCRYCGAIDSILAALGGYKAAHECRVLCRRPRGTEALDLKIWGTPLRWKGEQFVLVAAVDISHEKRRQVLERIFFHDILNTAGTIGMMTEMLMQGMLSFDEVKEDLRETAKALVEEIRGQRELLAAECNELKVHPSLLASRDMLESVASIYRNSKAGKGKQIAIDEESAAIHFLSDATLLGRVLGNLLKNALEASEAGGTVTVGCRCDGPELAFWCKNDGVMPQEVQLQMFQRSFSTKGIGRGIGTYSVKLLMERYLQGRVSFVSTPETGTIFTAACPIRPEMEAGFC